MLSSNQQGLEARELQFSECPADIIPSRQGEALPRDLIWQVEEKHQSQHRPPAAVGRRVGFSREKMWEQPPGIFSALVLEAQVSRSYSNFPTS